MKWVYKTNLGTFSIVPARQGGFDLWIGDEHLGHYTTPHQAADDVYTCTTGHYPWDCLAPVTEPSGLDEWVHSR